MARIKSKTLQISDFIISCRALGIGLENYIFNDFVSIAKLNKLNCLIFKYRETNKNMPIYKFLVDKNAKQYKGDLKLNF